MRIGWIEAKDRMRPIFKNGRLVCVFVTRHEATTFSLTEVWSNERQRRLPDHEAAAFAAKRVRFIPLKCGTEIAAFAAVYQDASTVRGSRFDRRDQQLARIAAI
jgi:hypothetical protein